MACPSSKRLCQNLVISQSVSFTGGNLVINIPAADYSNNHKYCIIVGQNIPDTTTINAPVVITIGSDTTTTYPLMNCNCVNVKACSINKRIRYSVVVHTDINQGVFKLLGRLPCSQCPVVAQSLPLPTTPTTEGQ